MEGKELDQNQMTSLKVLGFLYQRLGFFDRAARLFRALFALSPEDAEVVRNLAAALIEEDDAEEALRLLDAPSRHTDAPDPALLLLKARALWRLKRNEEAFAVMNTYLATNGEPQ
jgi:Flp pilus assembly protein TadD